MAIQLTAEQKRLYYKLVQQDTYNKLALYFPDVDVTSVDGKTYYSRDKYPKAQLFFRLGATYKQRAFMAGNGTGKTESALYEIVCHLTGLYPDSWEGFRFEKANDWWICGKTNKDIHQDIEGRLIGPIEDRGSGMIPRDKLVVETMTKAMRKQTKVEAFQVRHVSGKMSNVEFKSYDQDIASFRGAERNVWLDEPAPNDVYTECLARTRMGAMLLLTFTPMDGATDMVNNFTGNSYDEGDKGGGRYVVRCSKDEVPHLDLEQEKLDLMSYPAHEREARWSGEPTIGRGAVFPCDIDAAVIEPKKLSDKAAYAMAIDFGWFHPTACLWMAYDWDDYTWYITNEYKKAQAPPEEHAQHIHAVDAELKRFPYRLCDPSKGAIDPRSGRHAAEMYKDYEIEFDDANNDVDSSIIGIINHFNHGSLKIFSSCRGLIDELKRYQYNKHGRINKVNDDLVDCLRYLVNADIDKFSGAKTAHRDKIGSVADKLLKAQRGNRLF